MKNTKNMKNMKNMRKKNIHKIDDYLIRAGWVFCIGFLFNLPAGGRVALMWFALSFLLLLVGYVIRRQENKVIAVWNIIEQLGNISVDELARSTGLPRKFILTAVNTINLNTGEYYLHDPVHDRIIDRQRIQSESVSIREKCDSCGALIHLRVTTGQKIKPVCHYCGTPVSATAMNHLDNISVEQQLKRTQSAPRSLGKIEFSPLLFVVLLVVFPPAAIVYALFKASRYYW